MSDENNKEQQPTFSFGKRFSTARGALNLSREDVAVELKLGIEIIVAIEDEDYESLTAPIFVTGYIRNYARLLKIPVEPLLAAYNQVQVERPTIVAKAIRKSGPSYSRLLIKIASVLIVLVLLAGIISWFQSQDFEPSTWFSSPENTDSSEPVIELPKLVESDDLPASIEKKPEPVTELPAEVVAIPTPVVEPVAVPVPVEVTPQAAVEAPKNEILISLSNDSWVDIQDSTGKRLIYDLLRAGKEKRFTGKPPFKVFLGNAKGVRIEYNGELIDVDKHIRGNLARFKIGAAGE